jgi:hypothetical protein
MPTTEKSDAIKKLWCSSPVLSGCCFFTSFCQGFSCLMYWASCLSSRVSNAPLWSPFEVLIPQSSP